MSDAKVISDLRICGHFDLSVFDPRFMPSRSQRNGHITFDAEAVSIHMKVIRTPDRPLTEALAFVAAEEFAVLVYVSKRM